MKILYLSCHSILEYDEIKLLSELGHEIFSMGTYHNPGKIDDPKRPVLDIPYYPELEKLATPDDKNNINPALIDWADVILVMHRVDWIRDNWEKMRHKIVVLRTIGQSTADTETQVRPLRREGLKIIRYSPREQTIPGYCGGDTLIRFYKDSNEFKGWTGEKKEVITVAQSFQQRFQFSNWDTFRKATAGLPARVYGPHNEPTGEMNGGCPDYEGLKAVLRENRVFFYTGTHPASYTLGFIEAMMTGIPVVALGPYLGNSWDHPAQQTYEVPNIIRNGVNGFISDNLDELRFNIRALLENQTLAKQISEAGRKTAIKYFDKAKIKPIWAEFLNSLKGGE